jgi:hypothetical protein
MGSTIELLPGDTAVVHAGVYREWVNPARSGSASAPLVFQAAPGESVVPSGADVVSGWASVEEPIWKKEPWSLRFATHPNDQRHRLVGRCEQLIIDGQLLKQVELREQLTAGTFCADTDSQVLYVWLGQRSYSLHPFLLQWGEACSSDRPSHQPAGPSTFSPNAFATSLSTIADPFSRRTTPKLPSKVHIHQPMPNFSHACRTSRSQATRYSAGQYCL